jgi:VanZ family protein
MDKNKTKIGKYKAFLIYLLPVLIYSVLIFYLSVLPVGNAPPGEEVPPETEPEPQADGGGETPADSEPAKTILFLKHNIPYFNELANIFLYMIFGFLMIRMFQYYMPAISALTPEDFSADLNIQIRVISIVSCIALIYSVMNELTQMSLISRVADIYDVLYNSVGAAFGAGILVIKVRISSEKRSEINKY